MTKKPGFKIKTVTAFIAVDDDGDEGVMSIKIGDSFYPMVCGDEESIAQMLPHAIEAAKQSGKTFRVLQFSTREDVTSKYQSNSSH